jgi:hypothetical protein
MPITRPVSLPADNAAPYTYTQPIRDAITAVNELNSPGPLEGMLLYAYGHSYLATTSNNTTTGAGGNFGTRLAARRAMTFTNRAVSGIRLVHQAASSSLIRNVLSGGSAWTPNTRGVVLFCDTVNDVSAYGTTAAYLRSYEHAVRTFLAVTRSKAKVAAASAAWVYSANWTSTATSALTSTNRFETTTTGSYAQFNVTGSAVDLLLTIKSGGNGTYTITSDGTTVATVSSMNTTMGVDVGAATITLSGLGSGTHLIQVTLTSGTYLGVDAAFIPSETPPPVIMYGEGAVTASGYTSLAGTWLPILSSVTAEFPHALYVGAGSGWDNTTMLREDGLHPNDKGASYIAARILDAVDPWVGWSNGLNILTTAPSYSAPSAPTTPSGGQNGLGVAG